MSMQHSKATFKISMQHSKLPSKGSMHIQPGMLGTAAGEAPQVSPSQYIVSSVNTGSPGSLIFTQPGKGSPVMAL